MQMCGVCLVCFLLTLLGEAGWLNSELLLLSGSTYLDGDSSLESFERSEALVGSRSGFPFACPRGFRILDIILFGDAFSVKLPESVDTKSIRSCLTSLSFFIFSVLCGVLLACLLVFLAHGCSFKGIAL